MSRSFSQCAKFSCPQCRQPIQGDIWVIVDAEERPDLMDSVLNKTLHTIECAECGHIAQVDAPLIIHLPNKQRLFFIPPQGTNKDEDYKIVQFLVENLANTFELPPEYLNNVQAVPLQILQQLIDSENPDEVINQLKQELPPEAHTAMEILSALSDEERALWDKVIKDISSPEEFITALNNHPKLRTALQRVTSVDI